MLYIFRSERKERKLNFKSIQELFYFNLRSIIRKLENKICSFLSH